MRRCAVVGLLCWALFAAAAAEPDATTEADAFAKQEAAQEQHAANKKVASKERYQSCSGKVFTSLSTLGVVNYKVSCYNGAWRTLRDQKGVLCLVTQARGKSYPAPHGEWVLVYYDTGETTEAAILAAMTDSSRRGCADAQKVVGASAELQNTKVRVLNPVICAGDLLVLEVASNGRDALKLTLPEGWVSNMPATIKGTRQVAVQTSGAAEGLKMTIGGKTADLSCTFAGKKRCWNAP